MMTHLLQISILLLTWFTSLSATPVFANNTLSSYACSFLETENVKEGNAAGLIDGALEEAKSIPLLINLVVDYSTNKETQQKIDALVSDFDFTDAMDKWYESRKDLYTTGTAHQIEHRTGKDIVEVGTLLGTGGAAALGKFKNGIELVEELTNKVRKFTTTSADLTEFLAKSLSKKLDDIAEAWTASYPQIFFERKLFEDIMGHFRYPKGSGWGHTSDIAHNFKAIDFYKDFTKSGNKIYTETVVSMKTTTTKNVDNWLASNPVNKNLDNLDLGLGDQGIEWNKQIIYYNKVEVHIYMPKENITAELKDVWFNKLTTERPNIIFKIDALENFVK